ncbi:eukaryotic translation initiation factor 2D isoform X2 [Durio zibethinus]|uniref:Eukaryotic translation initiation factor 2D isoform X2 n=1 Tax=Durio zibethinus TaxID=66656 RepID=A0A6P6ASS8_DURZI|nr:eukaryotic translation initiation factor 2D isoform X2 [Durio zibethinus]
MFKKAVEAKAQQRLSGADRKKLRRTVRDKFPRASDADIDALLPPKAEIIVAKFQNRVHVYGVEGGFPVFFDVDGRGSEIYPTVFALWKVPELLPSFMLKGGEVSQFVIGGADLMFPGISVAAGGLASFSAGEPWAVKVPGNPAPIAVGSTTMSSDEALKAGLRGKALRIMHYYRDLLWESVEGHYVPNAGFLEDVVFEDPLFLASNQPSDSFEGDTHGSDAQQSHINNENIGESVNVNDVIAETSAASIQNDSVNAAKEITLDACDLKSTDNDAAAKSDIELYSLSIEDVDSHLDRCLLQALHTTVKDKDLPIPGSTLWSNHVLACRPSGITVDIKKSSHKKLSKWLQAKSSTGLITIKEDKYKKEAMLISVNRSHPDYLPFKPEKRPVEKVDQAADCAASECCSQKVLEVVEVYKSSVHVNSIFASVGADTGKLYSASEASDIVFKYIEKENLVKQTEKAIVVLDATLCDALFKGAIKKGSTYPTEIHKKDLGATFISRMQAHHIVTRGSESVVRKGVLKTVHIMTERRQGNKKVTKVSGLETFLIDAEALASELQKKFACSTTVVELPGLRVNILMGEIFTVTVIIVALDATANGLDVFRHPFPLILFPFS